MRQLVGKFVRLRSAFRHSRALYRIPTAHLFSQRDDGVFCVPTASFMDSNNVNTMHVAEPGDANATTTKNAFDSNNLDGIAVVQTKEQALRVLDIIYSAPADTVFACDTEVARIDVTRQSPVGNGIVVCASIYGGPNIDFDGKGSQSLWIDNMGDSQGVLNLFKGVFDSERIPKVWHNYSFDRHVLENHGITCRGLHADTMHMARLWDTARAKQGGYSLETLTKDLLNKKKTPMKELFAVPKLKKDGNPGKETYVPPVETLQTEPYWRRSWIQYSTYDAESTWKIYVILKQHLSGINWIRKQSMWDFYQRYWVPFAQVLTDMEREGIEVETKQHLPNAERLAKAERAKAEKAFISWACQYCPDASRMNVSSDVQRAHFLFAPAYKKTRSKGVERSLLDERPSKVQEAPIDPTHEVQKSTHSETLDQMFVDLEDVEAERKSTCLVGPDGDFWPRKRTFQVENIEGYVEPGKKKAKKMRGITLVGLGIPPVSRTANGWPAVSSSVLKKLAGQPFGESPKFGLAYDHFGGGKEGTEACKAIACLYDISAIDTMLSNFIIPLQQMVDEEGRIHCSLNLNTETGRLSARRPNLQNQPALEKDRYKVRQAFQARRGCKLIVADYGQLELRILAHMTGCKSMIDAFKSGGDFHSRTAMGMYDYIREDVESGKVLLEWDDSKGEANLPVLKDVYTNERRAAKILNFSIAYGKTATGLSKDFGVSVSEAKEIVEKWYADRPEVRDWQATVLDKARKEGATRTLMGRYRSLPDINSRNYRAKGHAERAAINTPIQGGAADVVMMAMLNVSRNQKLEKLGWKMLLQIHDEIIMEGPESTANEALEELMANMKYPFKQSLLVDLLVDANAASTWYEAK